MTKALVSSQKSTTVRSSAMRRLVLRVLETQVPAFVEKQAAQRFFMPHRILSDPQVIAEAVAFVAEPSTETKEDQPWEPLSS